MTRMTWPSAQLLLAFDRGHVAAAVIAGRRGSRRVRSLASAPLAGALEPSVAEPNVLDHAKVQGALRFVLDRVGGPAPALLLLPQSAARTVMVELPAGRDADEQARARLAPLLPYPAGEAVLQGMAVGPRRTLVAAVRRSVVAQYEELVARASVPVERVDLAHLAALSALQREPRAEPVSVDVVLGDDCTSFAGWRGGELRVFRTRLRDVGEDEAAWLRAEAFRTAALAGDAEPLVRVVGPGAAALIDELVARGGAARPGFGVASDVADAPAFEAAWLGAALT
jgi:hypothetical protein